MSNAEVVSLASRYSEFQKSSFVIEQFSERLLQGESLEERDIVHLSPGDLPFLPKLVEKLGLQRRPHEVSIRPITYLPLSMWLDSHGGRLAYENAMERLEQITTRISHQRLYLAIDRWDGGAGLSALLSLLRQICDRKLHGTTLQPVGPSTSDLQMLAIGRQRNSGDRSLRNGLVSDLEQFIYNGLETVEGGCDLEIHRTAARAGMSIAIGQLIVPERTALEELPDPSAIAIDSLATRLLACRKAVPAKLLGLWFPIAARSTGTQPSPIGVSVGELLFAIALARLVLSRSTRIRAPLTVIGAAAARMVHLLGVDDLGYAAVDAETANTLNIARISEAPRNSARDSFDQHIHP